MKKEMQPQEATRWQFMFRALQHRNFRLFFMGQSISLIGTWMQMTAVAWLVWRLEHNAVLLGLTGFAVRIPAFILAPLTVILGGLCCIAASLSFGARLKGLQQLIHPIYIRQNTAPETANEL